MIFVRNYDNKRIDVNSLVDEYLLELSKKKLIDNSNNNEKVELSFIEDDDWGLLGGFNNE